MTAPLIHAADAAYPFDYALLPRDVIHVLGYVGKPGSTPHLWTAAEVAECRAAGKSWHPIWTVPQRALSTADGLDAANGTRAALAAVARGYTGPVFLDVERSAWMANPAGARNCIATWSELVRSWGYGPAVPYVPWDAQTGWVANWTGTRPAALPAGVLGWQYASDGMLAQPFDLSVFHPSVFSPSTSPTPPPEDPVTPAEIQSIAAAVHNYDYAPFGSHVKFGQVVADVLSAARDAEAKSAAALTALADVARAVAALTAAGQVAPDAAQVIADALRGAADKLNPSSGGTP